MKCILCHRDAVAVRKEPLPVLLRSENCPLDGRPGYCKTHSLPEDLPLPQEPQPKEPS